MSNTTNTHISYWVLAMVFLPQYALQWQHNDVSNHRRLDCLPTRFFRRRSKKRSKLRATGLCEGNSPVTGDKGPVTRKMFPFQFDDVIMEKYVFTHWGLNTMGNILPISISQSLYIYWMIKKKNQIDNSLKYFWISNIYRVNIDNVQPDHNTPSARYFMAYSIMSKKNSHVMLALMHTTDHSVPHPGSRVSVVSGIAFGLSLSAWLCLQSSSPSSSSTSTFGSEKENWHIHRRRHHEQLARNIWRNYEGQRPYYWLVV